LSCLFEAIRGPKATLSLELELDDFMTVSTALRLPILAFAIAAAVAILPYAPRAAAQDGPSAAPQAAEVATDGGDAVATDEVFATVDGQPVTAGDLLIAAEDYARQVGGAPGNLPLGQLLDAIIDMRLLARAAEQAGLGDDPAVERRLAFERMRALRDIYIRQEALAAVTDEAVQAQYEKEKAEFEPQDELHLQHILVETEDEAKEIIADLDAGGDFAEIAREKSADTGSGASGGDLGFVPRGATVPEFEDAAFALEVGEVTDAPVQSQYGWHVIRLDEKRETSAPEFATVENRIRGEMIRAFVTDKVEELRAAADIEIIEPEKPAADGGEAPGDGGEMAPAEPPAQ
jgi:peptidyl-prolyl cis-trans isomerase C